jgi:predicted transcriptional regulator
MSRERLRAEIAEGFRQLDRGESFDGEEVFADVHREIDALEAHRLEN